MPPHPRVKNPQPGWEKTKLGAGGIRFSYEDTDTRRSLQQLRSRANRLLVLRTNFTGSTAEFDTFSLGMADNVYDSVKGEVERYFEEQSHGKHLVDLYFPPMVAGIAFPNTHQFYGSANPVEVESGVLNVLAQWDPHVDYSLFDSVLIMHAGTGKEVHQGSETLINSFRSTFTDPYESEDGVTIFSFVMVPEHFFNEVDTVTGVIAHEYGHELGLPDLYDTTFQSEGIGNWGVMAGGSFGGPGNDGTVPVGFCAWSRIFLGWEEAEIAATVSYDLLHPALGGKILKIYAESSSNPSEYFLLENRYNGSLRDSTFNWDQYLPMDGSSDPTGVLIMHVDESVAFQDASLGDGSNRWDGNELQVVPSRKFLDVEEASSAQDLDQQDGLSDATDTWSSSSAVPFSQLDPFLAEPYSGNPNQLSVSFTNVPTDSMEIAVSQGFQVVSRNSTITGILLLGFSSEVNSSQTTSFYNIAPSLGDLSVARVNPSLVEVRYTQTPDRSQEYTLIFSGAVGAVGEVPSSVPNVLGTSVSAYVIEGGQRWTESKSPYVLTQDLLIESASTLVLESGTVVLIDSGFSGSFPSTKVDITVKGQLLSLGTAGNPVRFLPRAQDPLPSWGSILLSAPQDKPSVFLHSTIMGGGIGNNGCVAIRDDAEHILAYSIIESCSFGIRVGENYSTQEEGVLRGGGGRPRIYQTELKNTSRGLLLDSSNPNGLYLNNTFKDFTAVGFNFQALGPASLENFRFYNFEGTQFTEGAFEFANTSDITSGPVLNLAQLNEFHLVREDDFNADCRPCSSPCDRCSLMQFDPAGGSIFGAENSSLSEPVSTDFNISLIEFLPSQSSQAISTLTTVDSFRVRVSADSLTNYNATTKRLLAIKLEVESSGHPVLVPLEEESPNSKTFLSELISTSQTGVSSSTHLVFSSKDQVQAEDIASGLKKDLNINFLSLPVPASPSVTLLTALSNPLASWTWTSGGDGNGTYRYELDDSDLSSGATLTTETSFGVTEPLTDGWHTLYVQETNAEGSWSLSGFASVLIDTFVPTPSVNGLALTSMDPPTWTWSSGGADGNGIFRYLIDDQSFDSSAPLTSATSLTPSQILGEGSHTLYVQEQDGLGNWSDSGSFTTTIAYSIENSLVLFEQDFQDNRSIIQWRFTTKAASPLSSASLEFSTNAQISWEEASAFNSISLLPETTHSLQWTPFFDVPPAFSGEIALRMSLTATNSQTHSDVITFSYLSTSIETTINYHLNAGWNLIAVYPSPQLTVGEFFSAVSSSLSSCAFSYQNDRFFHYCPESVSPPPGSTSVPITTFLTYGSGFWLHLDSEVEVGLPSLFQPDHSYALQRGWNLLSTGFSGSSTPQHLPSQVKLMVDYLNPPGYRASLPSSQDSHNLITSVLSSYSLTRAAWIYASSETEIPNRTLPGY